MLPRAMLVLVVCMAACDARYGTYLEIDGQALGAPIDRVELYFGAYQGERVPATERHLAGGAGRVYTRQFAGTDVIRVDEGGAGLTYYLPPTAANHALGAYVVAVAFAGDVAVGIAELADFKIETGRQVRIYELVLAPYDPAAIELWGAGAAPFGCLRWERPGANSEPATVAVVRDGDLDCDGQTVTAELVSDCDDLVFCVGASCDGASCVDAERCGLGVCKGSAGAGITCEVHTCLVPVVCELCLDEPAVVLPPAELIACGLERTPAHTQITIPVLYDSNRAGTSFLCAGQVAYNFALPDGMPCTDPRILAPAGGITSDGFAYAFTDFGDTCGVQIKPLASGAAYLYDDVPHHVLLSIHRDSGRPRMTVMLGIQPPNVPVEPPLACTEPARVTYVEGEVYGTCQ